MGTYLCSCYDAWMLTRRTTLFGLLAAPAIIRTPGLLMPVRSKPLHSAYIPGIMHLALLEEGVEVGSVLIDRYSVATDGTIIVPDTTFDITHCISGEKLQASLMQGIKQVRQFDLNHKVLRSGLVSGDQLILRNISVKLP